MLRLFRFLSLFPLRWLHRLGFLAGWAAYLGSASYRRNLRENMARAGFTAPALRAAAIAAAGQQALEPAWIWLRSGAEVHRAVEVDDPALLAQWLADPRPLVLLTPHLGCFEVAAQYWMLDPQTRRRPMTALYRVPRKESLRPLLEQARTRNGLKLAPAQASGVRLLLRALRAREVVGILPDQVPSNGEGAWAPFFGRPAYTMTLPARLAIATGARVGFLYALRLPAGRGYRLHCTTYGQALTGNPQEDAAALNAALEGVIRQAPAQYLWGYKRYKVPAGAPAPLSGVAKEAAS